MVNVRNYENFDFRATIILLDLWEVSVRMSRPQRLLSVLLGTGFRKRTGRVLAFGNRIQASERVGCLDSGLE
jgi:hypothetical protein